MNLNRQRSTVNMSTSENERRRFVRKERKIASIRVAVEGSTAEKDLSFNPGPTHHDLSGGGPLTSCRAARRGPGDQEKGIRDKEERIQGPQGSLAPPSTGTREGSRGARANGLTGGRIRRPVRVMCLPRKDHSGSQDTSSDKRRRTQPGIRRDNQDHWINNLDNPHGYRGEVRGPVRVMGLSRKDHSSSQHTSSDKRRRTQPGIRRDNQDTWRNTRDSREICGGKDTVLTNGYLSVCECTKYKY